MKKVAIIGAGISGLFFANLLRQNSNYETTIYEKNNSINLEKGYGIQISTNSIKLLNKIGFQNLNLADQFNPKKINFYSLLKKNKICDLDISSFNTEEAKYTTMQRSILVEFLKAKLPSNLMQYNKIVSKINSNTENIELTFEDQSSARCDYLVVSDGIFSSTKSLILNRDIKPKYFKSIAIRGTINKEDLDSIDCSNISLFLGSNFHSVIYPVNKDNKLNFIGILRKNLSEDQLKDHSLFDDKNFLSSILSNLYNQIDQNILNNLKNIKCFPIFASEKVYKPKQKNIFFIGDAFFTFLPTFAQGASQSIEAAFELYESLKNGNNKFINQRIKRTKMINKRSKFNYFVFHLSNPFMTYIRDLVMKNLVKNKKFTDNYLGKIYKVNY
jgi:salicylate hydroxylase